MRRHVFPFAVTLAVTLSACLFAAPAPAVAQTPTAPAGTYVLEKTHASLLWRIAHMGMSQYTARFKSFDASIRYDPIDPAKSSVQASVDLASVETDFLPAGGRDFNAEIRSPRFLDVSRVAKAVFQSSAVKVVSPGRLQVTGSLGVLGVTVPMNFDVTINGAVAQHPFAKVPWLGVSARGKLQRSAIGLNPMPELTGIGDEVELIIEAEFIQKP